MALFGFGKRKDEEHKAAACCCGCSNAAEGSAHGCCSPAQAEGAACCSNAAGGIRSIKVLGAGCRSCHEQYENALAAVKALGLPVEVEYITDMAKVMEYGVMSMPAIVVNENVVSMGKVLKPADVEKLLRKLGV
ncbi:MAG: thioredoxin family protein [Candidatus Fimadaptatus sp.]